MKGKVEVTFFPQIHAFFDYQNRGAAERERITRNQFQMTRFLLENNDSVFLEGWFHSGIDAAIREWVNKQRAKEYFPQGFPNSYERLTASQKQFLFTEGGAETLYYLGLMDRPKPPGTRLEIARAQKAHAEIPRRFFSADYKNWQQIEIMDRRELNTIKAIERFLNGFSYDGKKIIIIFGRRHDFSKYFRTPDVQFVIVNEDI